MFFLDTTPNTSSYMIAGYTVAFVLIAVYLVSLIVRWRNLRQDYTVLKSIEAEEKEKAEAKLRTEEEAADAKTVKSRRNNARSKSTAKKKTAAKTAKSKTTSRKK